MHASQSANASSASNADSPSEPSLVPITARAIDAVLGIDTPRLDALRFMPSPRVSEREIAPAFDLFKVAVLADASRNHGRTSQ